MIDDLLDFAAEPQAFGKSVHADIREGKMTLPLIMAASRRPALLGALGELISAAGGDTDGLSRRISGEVRALGAVEEVRREAAEHTAHAIAALRGASGGDGEVMGLLCALAEALQRRET
jgi:geranylgeranyl pyrophosphate synthase